MRSEFANEPSTTTWQASALPHKPFTCEIASPDVLDDLYEFVDAVAVVAGEADELLGFGDHGAALGGRLLPRDRRLAAAKPPQFRSGHGPKHDFWLAKTIGAITTAVGASLIVGSGPEPSTEARVLAIGTASAFTTIDVVYGLKRRISAVYLLDAGLQGAIIVTQVRRMINRDAAVTEPDTATRDP